MMHGERWAGGCEVGCVDKCRPGIPGNDRGWSSIKEGYAGATRLGLAGTHFDKCIIGEATETSMSEAKGLLEIMA
ncbi:unnamed protein product [Ilex paraguariensis]|uniref:Uncharacterized protein n=1 Tax=Ilex paraguariensis TaxID=185542 RepID=A0ABC8TUH6_9AQUA